MLSLVAMSIACWGCHPKFNQQNSKTKLKPSWTVSGHERPRGRYQKNRARNLRWHSNGRLPKLGRAGQSGGSFAVELGSTRISREPSSEQVSTAPRAQRLTKLAAQRLCGAIGLFGTVVGIIRAFQDIGLQGSNLATVAPGISEALVVTPPASPQRSQL